MTTMPLPVLADQLPGRGDAGHDRQRRLHGGDGDAHVTEAAVALAKLVGVVLLLAPVPAAAV